MVSTSEEGALSSASQNTLPHIIPPATIQRHDSVVGNVMLNGLSMMHHPYFAVDAQGYVIATSESAHQFLSPVYAELQAQQRNIMIHLDDIVIEPKKCSKFFRKYPGHIRLIRLRGHPPESIFLMQAQKQPTDKKTAPVVFKNSSVDSWILFEKVTDRIVPVSFSTKFDPLMYLSTKVSVDDINFRGHRVLLRVDFNVPVRKDGSVKDDFRIRSSMPTIHQILQDRVKCLILLTHRGRPKGHDIKYTNQLLLPTIQNLLPSGTRLRFAPDCINAQETINTLEDGDVILLENTRFVKAEQSKDENAQRMMAQTLASYGTIFVNDAFGVCHREAASVTKIAQVMGISVAGKLVAHEVQSAQRVLVRPQRPFVAIIGGAKVTDKIKALRNLAHVVDVMMIGGAMSYPFLQAQGISVGKSFLEKDRKTNQSVTPIATELLEYFKTHRPNLKLFLPVDHAVVKDREGKAPLQYTDGPTVPDEMQALDLGPKTVALWKAALVEARTIVWNGPLGVAEDPRYAYGTHAIAATIAQLSKNGSNTERVFSFIGGGDTTAAIKDTGFLDTFSHVTTGGGAILELLEGTPLPGLRYLTNKINPRL